MTPELWRRLQELLDQALEMPPESRSELVARSELDAAGRRRLEGLIRAAEEPATALDRPPIPLSSIRSLAEPRRLGAYQLLESLDRGGMGSVFLARRTDDVHSRRVAIKLLQMGLETEEMVRRFRREREILAQMEHPNIAHLLDGGTAPDGRPYLVMELVEGEPIDRYCDSVEASIEERLRLFQKVCSAVHFAHQNLVVHRDLKPANILVTAEGVPKLLDFGIAKLLSTENFPLTVVTTAPDRALMTPAYASPEQMRGDRITTASDVYSLGVLLYQLLTGFRPHQVDGLSRAEVQRLICEEDPRLPSAVLEDELADPAEARRRGRRLAGDLDNIVLMALRKEPQRRYISAEQLAEDIERHLTGLPVVARKDTFTYRAGKFVGRHRVAVASAATAVVLLLCFIEVLLIQQREVVGQRDRFESTAEFLIEIFENPNPERSGDPNLSARQLLDRGASSLDKDLGDQPEVQADMRSVIGLSYHGLGQLEEAANHLERALADHRRIYGNDHPKVAKSLRRLAQLESDLRLLDAAEAHAEEALAIHRRWFEPPHPDLANSLYRLAWIRERRGEYSSAESLYRQALAMARELDEESGLLADILTGFGILLRENAQYPEAEIYLDESLEILRDLVGEEHARTAAATNSLGLLMNLMGRFELAEEQFRRALAIARKVYGEGHPEIASIGANLGKALENQGRYEEAEEVLLAAVALGRQLPGPEGAGHPVLAYSLLQLASLYEISGRRPEAAVAGEEALGIRRAVLGDEHKEVAAACDHLARIYQHLGRFEEADALFREALDIYTKTVGTEHPLRGKALNNLGALAFNRGDRAAARGLFEEALTILREVYGKDHPDVGTLAFNLGYLSQDAGDLDRAEVFLGEALDVSRRALGADHPTVGIILLQLGRLSFEQERWLEAEQSARLALEILADRLPYEHNRRRQAEGLLARSLSAQGRPEAAQDAIRDRYLWALREFGPDDKKTQNLRQILSEVIESSGQDPEQGLFALDSMEESPNIEPGGSR